MPNTNERAVLTDVTGGIGTVTLNKPWKLNAWDTPMRAEIADVLDGWNTDARVSAVVMTGAGDRAFWAGQDLDETEKFQSGNEGANWFQSWRDFYNSIRDLDKPCLAALNGVAAGSAFQAVMLTDVRVGHPGVRMGQAEINSGIPSVTGPMLMLPRIGLARTMELTLTGRMMEAEECRAIGLIHYLVERPEQVMAKTREVAETDGRQARHGHAAEQAALPPGHAAGLRRGVREWRGLSGRGLRVGRAAGGDARVLRRACGPPQGALEAQARAERRCRMRRT